MLGTVRQIESTGRQQSNALEISLKGKISRFISGQAQYTFSKTLNDTSGIGFFSGEQFLTLPESGAAQILISATG